MRGVRIDPGALRERVVLEAVSGAADGQGGWEPGWTAVAEVFALVEPGRVSNRVVGDGRGEVGAFRVTVRFREGLEAGMRFGWGGRKLDITGVQDPDGTRRFLRCAAQEARP